MNEQKIWNKLASCMTKAGAAGVMGNLFAESALNPKNLQNSYEQSLGYSDDSYTKAVDSGKYLNFVKDSAGYGLAQWTHSARKQKLLDFAKSKGVSIGDLDMQLEFLIEELKSDFSGVWSTLVLATDVKEASNVVLFKYESPANQGISVQNTRYEYSMKYYNMFATNASPVKCVTDIAKEVLSGVWGNGDERKSKLESAGYNYSEVQKEVNKLLSGILPDNNEKKTHNVTIIIDDHEYSGTLYAN